MLDSTQFAFCWWIYIHCVRCLNSIIMAVIISNGTINMWTANANKANGEKNKIIINTFQHPHIQARKFAFPWNIYAHILVKFWFWFSCWSFLQFIWSYLCLNMSSYNTFFAHFWNKIESISLWNRSLTLTRTVLHSSISIFCNIEY